MGKTKLQETKDYMQSLKDSMKNNLDQIDTMQKEAEGRARTAAEAMNEAMKALDAAAYDKAKAEKTHAENVIEMYRGRRDQIVKKGFLPEKESDAVIDGLLQYEADLADKYRADIAGHVRALQKLSAKYAEEVRDVENTIELWGYEIHPNYKDRGNNRRENNPIRVHVVPYLGVEDLAVTEKYLRTTPIEKILQEGK